MDHDRHNRFQYFASHDRSRLSSTNISHKTKLMRMIQVCGLDDDRFLNLCSKNITRNNFTSIHKIHFFTFFLSVNITNFCNENCSDFENLLKTNIVQ